MKHKGDIIWFIFLVGAAIMAVPFFYQLYGKSQTDRFIKAFGMRIGLEELSEPRGPDVAGIASYSDAGMVYEDGAIGMIEIDSIGVHYPIMEGEEKEQLAFSVGHLPDTSWPGYPGNCVLAGHRGSRYGPIFKHLNQVQMGDEVKITTLDGSVYRYNVKEAFVTTPDDPEVKMQNQDVLTLVTCEKKGTMRLIIRCAPD